MNIHAPFNLNDSRYRMKTIMLTYLQMNGEKKWMKPAFLFKEPNSGGLLMKITRQSQI